MVDRSSHFDQEQSDEIPGDRTTAEDAFFAPALASAEGEIMGSHLIILPEGISRAEAIAHLSKDIPLVHGLPQYFIRSDLLPNLGSSSSAISQDDVDAASVGLSYVEGYPTLEDGRAFWNQMPHEPQAAFGLFQQYLEQAENEGIRQLDLLGIQSNTPTAQLREYYSEFYWSPRARAYDLFIIAAQERKRQVRVRSMENRHFESAGKLLEQLLTKFEEVDEEGQTWVDQLEAAEAVEVLETLAKLQRLSVGLTGANASSISRNPIPEGASPQAILEHLTKDHVLSDQSADDFQAKLRSLLMGGDGMEIQDAIIRFTRPQVSTTTHGAYQED